jgi:hypothetical protein
MTHLLTRLLRFILNAERHPAIVFLAIFAASLWKAIVTLSGHAVSSGLRPLLETAAILAFLTIAVWQVPRTSNWAKFWAVAAGIVNLAVLVHLLHSRFNSENDLAVLVGAVVVVGLVVSSVWTRLSPKLRIVSKRAPIPGDGTSRALNRLVSLLGFSASVAGIVWWILWTHRSGIPVSVGIAFFFQLLAIGLVVTVVHELGHTITGLGLGMKLRLFQIGPLAWRVREGRWAFKFNRKELFAASGATGMAPTSPRPELVDRILLVAGGPLANLLAALLAFGIAIPGGDGNTGQWRGIVALFAVFSLIGFAFNLIPMPSRRSYSDGAQIYQLLAGGPWADWQRAAFGATATLVTPYRPRDLDLELMRRAAKGIRDPRRVMQMWLYCYEHFLDMGQWDDAIEAVRKAESVYPQVVDETSAGLLAIFVFANALLIREAAAARIWWERLESKEPTRFNGGYWLAHSSLHWIEGDVRTAGESWQKGNNLVQKQPKAGAYEFNRHCFALLRQAMDEVPVSV